uniref:Putative conserved plasma membrane protein n=1 Tax=Panstrongylus megistus TaxID=65343 RepID=A0A069DPH9_9HEMI
MGNIMENLPSCIWFEGGDKKNAISSLVAGLLFFTGWWLTIDANATHSDSFHGAYHVCGIIGTLSLFMINSVSSLQMQGDTFAMQGGWIGPRGARLWLFVGFVLGFAAVIASCWILFSEFIGNTKEKDSLWVGTALFLQNLFIFAGSLVFKFGRVEDPWH